MTSYICPVADCVRTPHGRNEGLHRRRDDTFFTNDGTAAEARAITTEVWVFGPDEEGNYWLGTSESRNRADAATWQARRNGVDPEDLSRTAQSVLVVCEYIADHPYTPIQPAEPQGFGARVLVAGVLFLRAHPGEAGQFESPWRSAIEFNGGVWHSWESMKAFGLIKVQD